MFVRGPGSETALVLSLIIHGACPNRGYAAETLWMLLVSTTSTLLVACALRRHVSGGCIVVCAFRDLSRGWSVTAPAAVNDSARNESKVVPLAHTWEASVSTSVQRETNDFFELNPQELDRARARVHELAEADRTFAQPEQCGRCVGGPAPNMPWLFAWTMRNTAARTQCVWRPSCW
ncbi:MAG: hypothetical protein JWQ72_658 [Polaromonas sp.]|nr:hypothetical protein [Polaromonas sp.]